LLLLAGCGARTPLESGAPVDEVGDAAQPEQDAAQTRPQSILLFGGLGATPDGGDGDEDDTWIWTATNGWTEAHPPQSPSARYGAMAASLGGDIILFGGDGSTAETWAWDGVTWTQQQPSYSPPTLTSSVFSPLGQSLVLFGGYNSGIIYDDVWRWDGTNWMHESPSVTPSPREAPAGAVLDGSLVIFGGEDVNFSPLGDTWVYDGTSWTQMQPAHSPSPRRGAVATAFDGKIVLFGGDTIPPSYGDWLSVDETWVWDGTDWTQQQPAQSPDARSFAGMAAAGGLVVLFGGGNFGGSFAAPVGTWTWDGTRWTQQMGPGPAPRNYPAMAAR
jgi:N-acetylneuraminic acid mutarotase